MTKSREVVRLRFNCQRYSNIFFFCFRVNSMFNSFLILNFTSNLALFQFLLSVFVKLWCLETFIFISMPQDKSDKNKQYSTLLLGDNIFLQVKQFFFCVCRIDTKPRHGQHSCDCFCKSTHIIMTGLKLMIFWL